MNFDTADSGKQLDAERRVKKGYAEFVEYTYVDLEQVFNGETGEFEEQPVQKTRKYVVGKMMPKQTSGVISILATLFVNGMGAKEADGRKDNITFIEVLDEYHLTLLVAVILGEEREWLLENWDTEEVFKVVGVFFKYNNFFSLLRSLVTMVQGMGITEEQARKVALGAA